MIKVNYDTNTGEIKGYYPDDIPYPSIPEPYIEIDEAAHQDCIANSGLRRVDVANKIIVEYTPPEPTAEEKQAQAIAALDAEYQPQFASLAQSLGLATMDGNQAVQDEIKADYAALKTEYQQKREAISNG